MAEPRGSVLQRGALERAACKTCQLQGEHSDIGLFQSKLSILIEFPWKFQNAKRFQYKLAAQASASQPPWKCTRLRVELVLSQHQNLRVELVCTNATSKGEKCPYHHFAILKMAHQKLNEILI